MKNKILTIFSLLLLSACGGGSESNSSTTPPPTGTNPPVIPPPVITPPVTPPPEISVGKLELGPVKDSVVSILTLDDILLQKTTTSSSGDFQINIDELKREITKYGKSVEIVKVVSEGGIDTDPDDDGVFDPNEEIKVTGNITGYIPLEEIYTKSDYRVNFINSYIHDITQNIDSKSLNSINHIVESIGLTDINKDGKIDIQDVVGYKIKENETVIESQLRQEYLPFIHDGNNTAKDEYTNNQVLSSELTKVHIDKKNNFYQISFDRINKSSSLKYSIANSTADINFIDYVGSTIDIPFDSIVMFHECYGENCSPLQYAVLLADDYAVGSLPATATVNELNVFMEKLKIVASEISNLDSLLKSIEDEIQKLVDRKNKVDQLIDTV